MSLTFKLLQKELQQYGFFLERQRTGDARYIYKIKDLDSKLLLVARSLYEVRAFVLGYEQGLEALIDAADAEMIKEDVEA
jgi:hypothetical protein